MGVLGEQSTGRNAYLEALMCNVEALMCALAALMCSAEALM